MTFALFVILAQVFAPAPTERVEALRFGAALPDFEAKDVLGKTWRLDDLRGKYTLVYLWNTPTARGMDGMNRRAVEIFRPKGLPDMQEVERVYQEARRSEKIQVLTFCTDYDYTHARDYMQERQFTFPVIADFVVAKKLFDGTVKYAVVNPEGRLSEPIRSWSFSRLLLEAQRTATGLR